MPPVMLSNDIDSGDESLPELVAANSSDDSDYEDKSSYTKKKKKAKKAKKAKRRDIKKKRGKPKTPPSVRSKHSLYLLDMKSKTPKKAIKGKK